MDFNAASSYILHRLRQELNPALCYHCVEHTLDVLEATRRLADSENADPHTRMLVETAALYHDAGMMVQYADHESASVELARQVLPGFDYSASETEQVAGIILVTKLPQRPCNLGEQIICDADLDYLGRDDFFMNSFKLRREWQVYGVRDTTLSEWMDIQVDFLSEHQYFTRSAILLRNAKKLDHLREIKKLRAPGKINS
jgi:uncharacterized protein